MAFVALGGDAGGTRPTYFEAYAAAALVPSLRSAAVYALSVFAQRSAVARALLPWEDEACAFAVLLLDWHSLKSSGGTFAESIYGLRREPMRQRGGRRRGGGGIGAAATAPSAAASELSRRDVTAALATEVLLPYLLLKCDRLHAWLLPYVAAARRRRLQLLQEEAQRGGDASAASAAAAARAVAAAAAQLSRGAGGVVGLATARAAANMALAEARRARRQREARRVYESEQQQQQQQHSGGQGQRAPPPPARVLPDWAHAALRMATVPLARGAAVVASAAMAPFREEDEEEEEQRAAAAAAAAAAASAGGGGDEGQRQQQLLLQQQQHQQRQQQQRQERQQHLAELTAERVSAACERAAGVAATASRRASAAAAAARETRAARAAQVAGLSLLLSLYPLARSALEMARFGYQANYLLSPPPPQSAQQASATEAARGAPATPTTTPTTPTHLLPPSPLMHLAGQRLVRTSGFEAVALERQRASKRDAQLARWGPLNPRMAVAAAAATGAGAGAQLSAAAKAAAAAARARVLRASHLASDHARSALILAVFGFKALEWWYSSAEARLAATRALPPPPPPKPPPPHPRGCGLAPSSSSPGGLCPLCRHAKAAPAALAVSGYVFCYACVFGHVSEHGCCPVTLMPARLDDVRRLYESA
jgi:hypothetical protein